MPYAHIRFTGVRITGQPSQEIGSGGIPAGSDPGTIGVARITGSTIRCTDTGDSYCFDGTDWDQDLNVNSTFQDAASTMDLVAESFTTPLAPVAASVHAAYNGDNAVNDFPGAFTNPDMPRTLQFVFGVGYDGGDITPVGTDARDAAATEVITNPGAGGGTVYSTKAYKTVTAATKGAVGFNPATCSIGTWVGLGLLVLPQVAAGIVTCDGVSEPATWGDAANGTVEPTTVQNGAKSYKAIYDRAGQTSVVTATP